MGYRNEIYRVNNAGVPSVKTPDIPVGSFCVPASLQDWAQRGWDVFKDLHRAENSATRTNPKDSSILGLSYSLHHCHEGAGDEACEKLMLRIDSWTYDKLGETTDLPIMEVVFDAKQFTSPAKSIESLKIMARPAKDTEKVASRAVSAALFFINQINAGQVPDFERVLELHRIHPDLNRESGKIGGKTKGSYVPRSRTVSLQRPMKAAGGLSIRRDVDRYRTGMTEED